MGGGGGGCEKGGGGGGLSRTCVKSCFPGLIVEKNAGTFFHRKGVGVQWILSNLENRYEIVT